VLLYPVVLVGVVSFLTIQPVLKGEHLAQGKGIRGKTSIVKKCKTVFLISAFHKNQ